MGKHPAVGVVATGRSLVGEVPISPDAPTSDLPVATTPTQGHFSDYPLTALRRETRRVYDSFCVLHQVSTRYGGDWLAPGRALRYSGAETWREVLTKMTGRAAEIADG